MKELKDYFKKQAALDEHIHKQHNESYETTLRKRMLALLVELGEFANETRCFKFWSLKGPSEKSIILDEYADGLHFFFSLGIPLHYEDFVIENEECLPLYEQIIKVYQLMSELSLNYDKEHFKKAFNAYWAILKGLNFNIEEALEAYDKKLAVNYKRQENKY